MKPPSNSALAPILIAFLLVSGAACSSGGAPGRSLTANDGPPVTTVVLNPDLFSGERVVWGGSILHATSKDGGTEIKILEAPLDRWGVPASTLDSEGRFIGRLSAGAPEKVLRPGTFVTIAGEVAGKEREITGGVEVMVPVVRVREIRVWETSRRARKEPVQNLSWFWQDTPYPIYGPSSLFFPFH